MFPASTVELPTFFGVALTHTLAAAAAALDRSKDAIHVRRATPLLVREDIDAELFLAGLDETHIREHALVLERTRQLRRDRGVGVQAGQRNQLQHESAVPSV